MALTPIGNKAGARNVTLRFKDNGVDAETVHVNTSFIILNDAFY